MKKLIAKGVMTCSLSLMPAGLFAAAIPGMQVKDKTGATVGTISAVAADSYTIRTKKHDISVPASSLYETDGVLLFGMTQAQLDAAFEQAEAAANAAIVVGANVRGLQGNFVGKIVAFEDSNVIVETEGGKRVSLPRTGFTGDANGAILGISAEDLQSYMVVN